MAITLTNGSATIGVTEYSLPSVSTTRVAQTDDCILQPFIDVSAMAAGDEYRIRIYERVNGGTQRVVYESSLLGAQGSPIFAAPSLIVGDGWDVAVQKIAGTDRAIAWSLRKVA